MLDAASPEVSTQSPDAATPMLVHSSGPCAVLDENTCPTAAFFESDVVTSVCIFSGDQIRVDYEICEVCGVEGSLGSIGLVFMDCGGCDQVYAERISWDDSYSSHQCRDVRQTTDDLDRSRSDAVCVDVYIDLATSGAGTTLLGRHMIRACRCDRLTRTCVNCTDGACDP